MTTRAIRRPRIALILALAALFVPAPAAIAAANDTISDLSVSGSPFAENFAPLPKSVTVKLVLARPARVTVAILREDGKRVRRLALRLRLNAGQHSFSWDGRRANGTRLPDGSYRAQVRARNGLGLATSNRLVRKGLPQIYPANSGALVIAVDPGHGGRFPGAVRDGFLEKDFNLDIGLQLRDLLERGGVQVVMSRTTDVAVAEPPFDHNGDGLIDRYDDDLMRNDSANLARADVAVHVHNNASPSSDSHGTATYTSPDRTWTPVAIELAQLMVHQEFLALEPYQTSAFAPVERGVRFGWYYYVGPYDPPYLPRPTLMPSVLSESLYLSNAAELAALQRADIRLSLAAAIYISLAEWLNTRDYGLGYAVLDSPPAQVTAGGSIAYRVRLTNRGNRTSDGWKMRMGYVAAQPLYDGSGDHGPLLGSVAIPDGLAPGESVELVVAGAAPAAVGDWLVKIDTTVSGGAYLSDVGVVPLQLPLTTTPAR